jgi:hypothetical protein
MLTITGKKEAKILTYCLLFGVNLLTFADDVFLQLLPKKQDGLILSYINLSPIPTLHMGLNIEECCVHFLGPALWYACHPHTTSTTNFSIAGNLLTRVAPHPPLHISTTISCSAGVLAASLPLETALATSARLAAHLISN